MKKTITDNTVDPDVLTYTVGDVTIAFGPEADGGFYLYARHEALAALAKQDAPRKKHRRQQ